MRFLAMFLTISCLTNFQPLANAQISLREQQDKERPYGIGINIDDDFLGISVNSGSYTSKQSQVHFSLGLSFYNNQSYDISPIPAVGIGTLSVYPLKDSGMGFYSGGQIGGARLEIGNRVFWGFGFIAGGGIFKRIVNQSNFGITPFLGINWQRIYTTLDKEFQNFLNGEIGLELDISPTSTLIGSYHFSLQDSSSSFSIGLSFR